MVKVGVIGLGYWGPNLVRNFMNVEETELIACADKDQARIEKIKRIYPHLRYYSDALELIEDPDIEAVAIATPISTHYEIAKASLDNGKHILVEKPLTLESDEAGELVEKAQQDNLVIMVDHTFLFNGAIEKIKELLDSGEIGEVSYFDSVRINLGLFQHDVNVVWDLAIHDISILDYLFDGQKPEVISTTGIALPEFENECTAYTTLKYPNGVVGSIHVSWFAPVKIRRFIICGTRKMIVYDDLDPFARLKIYDKGVEFFKDPAAVYSMLVSYRTGDMVAPVLDGAEPLGKVCREFAAAITEGSGLRTPPERMTTIIETLGSISQLISSSAGKIQ